MRELRKTKHVKAVYDITIAYAHGTRFFAVPSMMQTLFDPDLGEDWKFHAHVERHLLESLPDSDDGLAKWLEERWIEKGQLLELYRDRVARGLPFVDAERQL